MYRGLATPVYGLLFGTDPWSEDPDPFGPNVEWSSGLPRWVPPWESDPYREGYATQQLFNSIVLLTNASVLAAQPTYPTVFQEPLGLGSTAKIQPRTIADQLAIEQVMRNPKAGFPVPLRRGMTDARWPMEAGWLKWQQIVDVGTRRYTIHYLVNRRTGGIDDFKITHIRELH
jgi:hypothetical protein